jgi:uncharacterized protein YhaN
MRFRRFELSRFGHFSDRTLDFPASPHDFHLVVGTNEAGKSTLRAAIGDFLFGIRHATPWGFAFDAADLRLAAALDGAPGASDLVRLKKRRGALTRPDGTDVDEAVLASALGVSREFYEQMFSLDHEELRAGGERILQSSGDVGQQLYEAAAGSAAFGAVRRSLQAELDTLWAPRKSATREWHRANEDYETAQRELRAATVTMAKWKDATKQLDVAEREHGLSLTRLAELRRRQSELERIRRTAPLLARRFERRAELVGLGAVPALPADAEATLSAAKSRLDAARTTLAQQRVLAAQAHAKLDQHRPDAAVLERAAEIGALATAATRLSTYPGDLDKRRAELAAELTQVQSVLAALGWPEADAAALRSRLPAVALQKRLGALVNAHARLGADRATAAAEVAKATRTLERAREALTATPRVEFPADLAAATAQASARRGLVTTVDSLATQVRDLEAQLARRLRELAPWSGDPASLESLGLPDEAEVLQFEAALSGAARAVDAAAADVARLTAALQAARETLAGFARDGSIIGREDVLSARAERDSLWSDLRHGRRPMAEAADDYEHRVRHADALVDRRLERATEAVQLDRARQDVAGRERDLAEAGTALARARANSTAAHDRWAARIAPLPDTYAPPAYRTWAAARALALATARELDERRQRLDGARADLRAAESPLVAALVRHGVSPDALAGLDLTGLVDRASRAIEAVEHARTQYERLEKSIESAQRELDARGDALAAAEEALRQWQAEWDAAVREAHLAGRTPLDVEESLRLLADLAKSLDAIDVLERRRIGPMLAELAALEREADLLAPLLPASLRGTAFETARRLAAALTDAERLRQLRTSAEEDLRGATDAIELATAGERAAEASLAPLYAVAGVGTLADLEAVLDRWRTARRLEREIAAATDDLLREGDGHSPEELAAAAEGRTLDDVRGELTRLDLEIREATDDCQKMAVRLQQARDAVDAIGGTAAADAEVARQDAIARLTLATERYMKLRVADRLLQWSVEKFRAERQGPLLERASTLFAQLTLGGFDRLVVDDDGDAPALRGRRRGGRYVDVKEMSEGTRDQLYLALRLAALDVHLSARAPLPFVADDLFVNFDRERSTAGLRALKSLSERTQVIFLTHHDFVVDEARAVFGDALNVVVLPRKSDEAAPMSRPVVTGRG